MCLQSRSGAMTFTVKTNLTNSGSQRVALRGLVVAVVSEESDQCR